MNKNGYYGQFGGAFIPEILIATIEELKKIFNDCRADKNF